MSDLSQTLTISSEHQKHVPRNRIVFAAVLMTLVFLSAGCRCPWTNCNAQLDNSSRWLQSGIEAFHDGRREDAEQLLAQAIQSRPNDPILREHLAEIYLENGKTSHAIQQLMETTQLQSGDAETLVKIGQIYLTEGKLISAEQYAKKALAADRVSSSALVLNADIELSKGHLTQALSDYQRSLSLKPNDPDVEMKIAEVHRLSGRPLRAFSTIEQLLAKIPKNEQPESALLLASRLLVELKQPAQAVEKLQQLTRRSDASPDSYLQLANAQTILGRTVDAQNTLATAQNIFSENAEIREMFSRLQKSEERIASVNSTAIPTIR